jgi:hypothetical protein
MALSNGKAFDKTPMVYLNPRSSVIGKDGKEVELEKPRFEVSRVNAEGKIEKTDETATSVSGNLTLLQFKVREWKDKKSNHVVVFLKDTQANETYYIDFPYRMSSRALFTAILSLENPNNLELSIYKSKKGYESYALRQNDEMVKWRYEIADMPAPDVIKDKKGEVVKTDFSEIDAFFEKNLKEFASKVLGNRATAPAADTKDEAPPATETTHGNQGNDSDVPF